MKKEMSIIGMVAILSFLLVTVLPCHADNLLCGCAKIKKGTLRLINCDSQCLKSEYSVTLSGTSQQNQNPLPNFEGELCWQSSGEPDNILQLGISYMGSSHYFASGTIYDKNGLKEIVFGSAESVGDNIYMNLIMTDSDEEQLGTAIYRITLNKSTLALTAENIGHEYERSSQSIIQEYGFAQANAIPCPLPNPL